VPISILALRGGGGLAASLLFVIAASTDYFDGWVARRFNQVTAFGARLDAAVDKIFIYALFGVLLYRGSYFAALVGTAFARDAFVEFMRQRAAAGLGVIPANRWGKSKFALQCVSVTIALFATTASDFSPWFVLANVTLAAAVLTSIPGVFTVWLAARAPKGAALI